MAFNSLEYLRDGKTYFIFELTSYDLDYLINMIRDLDNKNEIIDGFLEKLLDEKRNFCFQIIYDNDKYEIETKYLLDNGCSLDSSMILRLITYTSWGLDYIFSNPEEYIKLLSEIDLISLFNYLFTNSSKCHDQINYFRLCKNLHYRYLFMKYVIERYPQLFKIIYPNFLECLTSFTNQINEQLTFLPDLMDNNDICELAYVIFKSPLREEYFNDLKDYILKNYPNNDLALSFIKYRNKPTSYGYTNYRDEEAFEEFKKDADRLFLSSETEKFYLAKNYPELIKKDILDRFMNYYNKFRDCDGDVISRIEYYRLGNKLLEFIDKYLDLSKNKEWGYIESGTTGTVYRMGDYVLKLFKSKWSYEDVICPDLYLIVRNLEEIYCRDNYGIVRAGLEVQPYLSKSAKGVSSSVLTLFKEELDRLGYYTTDTLMGGNCGDNCRLLDSYLDADIRNPESLPEWFKKEPIVLVDRDRIYKKGKQNIKQLNSGY